VTAITPFRPDPNTRQVLERSAEIAAVHGGHVTVTDLALALVESFTAHGGDLPISVQLIGKLETTNKRLGQLITTMQALTGVISKNTQEASATMTTIAAAIQQFQVDANQAHADSDATRTQSDRAIKAMGDLEAALGGAGLTADQEATIAASLAELGQVHTEMVQRVADLTTASDTAEAQANPTPPPP